MNVAIIGTGNVGAALGRSLTRAGHDVTFYSRNEQKTADVASANDAATAGSAAQAVENADVIILAVPYAAAADVARELAPPDRRQGRDRYDESAQAGHDRCCDQERQLGRRGDRARDEVSACRQGVQHRLRRRPGRPGEKTVTPDALFAADNGTRAGPLAQLIESIGFRPVFVGPLAAARELEALAFLNIRMQVINGGSWDTAINFVDAPANSLAAYCPTTRPARQKRAGRVN